MAQGGLSHDAAAGLAPVGVPEGLFVELAGREPGQLAGEVDRPGAFEVGEVLAAEREPRLKLSSHRKAGLLRFPRPLSWHMMRRP